MSLVAARLDRQGWPECRSAWGQDERSRERNPFGQHGLTERERSARRQWRSSGHGSRPPLGISHLLELTQRGRDIRTEGSQATGGEGRPATKFKHAMEHTEDQILREKARDREERPAN